MLKRKFYDSLLEWKSNHGQECLLVKGARQVGKTFIIDYFGNANYSSYLYLNFVLNKEAAECFGDNLDADVIFKRFTARGALGGGTVGRAARPTGILPIIGVAGVSPATGTTGILPVALGYLKMSVRPAA